MSSKKRRLPAFLSSSSSSSFSDSAIAASDNRRLPTAARKEIDLTREDDASSSYSLSSSSLPHYPSCSSSSSSSSSPSVRLLELPRDLLLDICSFFSLFELRLYRSVCKLFASFTTTLPTVYGLYTSLSLQPASFSHPLTTSAFSFSHPQQEKSVTVYSAAHTARVMELLSSHSFPSVQTLHLGLLDLKPELLQLLRDKCGQVRSVSMGNCSREDGLLLHRLLQTFPQLDELHLSGLLTDDAAMVMANRLLRLRLTAFSYRTDGGQDFAVCAQIVHALSVSSSQSLQSLQLPAYGLHWTGRFSNLRSLSMDTTTGRMQLTELLSQHPQLSRLDIGLSSSLAPLFPEHAALLASMQDDDQRHKKSRKVAAGGESVTAVKQRAAAALPAQPAALPSFVQLRTLFLPRCRRLTAADVIGIGLVCPRLDSLNLSNNSGLRTQALRILLSQQHFPHLTELRVNNLRSKALPDLLTMLAASPRTVQPNSNIRLFHCDGSHPVRRDELLTAGLLQTLARILPCVRSLSLSFRNHIELPALSSLLASLPLLSSLLLLRMRVASLPELESLCLQYGPERRRRLRHLHVSLTGVLRDAREVRRQLGGRQAQEMLLVGERGDKARRLWAQQLMERVWLQTGCGVTLHIDVENLS